MAGGWRSKSRNRASNREIAFRGGTAEQEYGEPTRQLFSSTAVKAFYFVATAVQDKSNTKFEWTK